MRHVSRMIVAAVGAAAVAVGAMATGAVAKSPAATVAVPSPGGGGFVGCYRVAHTIYGPYQMSFCLNPGRAGSYKVTGGGLNCNGGLDWYDQNNGRVEIDLYRAPCGSGTDWTGDSLTCRASGWRPLLQGAIGAVTGQLGVPSVAVPVPSYGSLGCTYKPVAGGYSPISVTANRI